MGSAPTPQSSSGMQNNLAAALSYITIVGIIFLLIEPYNKIRFVRFHAFQSVFFACAWFVFWIGWWILSAILAAMTHGATLFLTFPLSLLISLGFFVGWIVCVVKAYGNQEFKLPIIGDLAAKQAG
ncbi:MAG: hypothetical protein LAO20_12105 [Acidobacteriia bacterium]|nr:hypothetical protein [Terriglobia bacterium]